jgi:L-ascorbate metabolism protein UlaG (beta-lactamase superfamily)
MHRVFLPTAVLLLTLCMLPVVAAAVDVDGDLFPIPDVNTLTFWGHACVYIDVERYGIVLDPVFERRTFLRWRRAPVPPAPSYAGTRLILITHAHPDHLSLSTIRGFPPEATILCPKPSRRYISTLGREVVAMSPGDAFDFPGGRVVAVLAQHAGTRYGVRSQTDGGALGYVIYTPGATVYCSGDTNVFDGMDEVAASHTPDIAVLNISGHLHGEDVTEAAERLGVETVIPVHFGAYGHLFIPAPKRPRDYEEMAEGLGEKLVLLGLGESYPLDKRSHNN